jgi:rSAM/selenodomain-associated transferase 2
VSRPYLSVIVPTLNAGDALDGVLRSIGRSNEVETIVADGGSTDGTLERAKADGIKVIACPRGRAAQMNLASAHVSGDVLLFLHSDTMLPPGYLDDVRRTLSRPGVIAGAFRFKTDYPARAMRLVEWTTNLRSRLLQLPYGDQGLFMRVSVFRRLGGFRELPIMDDFDFVRRARRLGRIGCAPTAAVTSGKRWRRLGIWRTALRNQAIVALYYCGVSAERLAQLYRRGTEDDR